LEKAYLEVDFGVYAGINTCARSKNCPSDSGSKFTTDALQRSEEIPLTTSWDKVGTYTPAYDSPEIKNGLEMNSGYSSNH